MKLFFILFATVVITACHTTKEGRCIHHDNASNNSTLLLQIPEELYLENRVANCDSAIVFMKNTIAPGNALWQGFAVRGESDYFLRVFKKDGKIKVQNNQRFYLSLDCLIGQNVQVALDIFVRQIHHNNLLNKINSSRRNYFVVNGFCSFYMVVNDGIITKAKYNFVKLSH